MPDYLYPGILPQAAQDHLLRTSLQSITTATITQPEERRCTVIPEIERTCQQFMYDARLTADAFENAVPTDNNGMLFLNLPERGRQVVNPNHIFGVTYNGRSRRMRTMLASLSQEYKVGISVTSAGSQCFTHLNRCICINTPSNEGVLNVHFNCDNQNGQLFQLESIYEFPTPGIESSLSPVRYARLPTHGGGQLIIDSNGNTLAEVVNNDIYILCNIDFGFEDYSWRSWEHNADVLERILREAIPIATGIIDTAAGVPYYVEALNRRRTNFVERADAIRARFITAMPNGMERQVTALMKSAINAEKEAAESREKWLQAARRAEDNRRLLNALRNQPAAAEQRVKAEFDHVAAMPEVVSIELGQGNTVIIYTETIYIQYNSYRYHIGMFKITIDYSKGSVTFYNMTQRIDGYQHPHVDALGIGCFGNIDEAVHKLVKDYSFEPLISLLIQYLQSYFHDNPHRNITAWPREQIREANNDNNLVRASA